MKVNKWPVFFEPVKIEESSIPAYARDFDFLVMSNVENELWFYGAYRDILHAIKACNLVGGVVFKVNWKTGVFEWQY